MCNNGSKRENRWKLSQSLFVALTARNAAALKMKGPFSGVFSLGIADSLEARTQTDNNSSRHRYSLCSLSLLAPNPFPTDTGTGTALLLPWKSELK